MSATPNRRILASETYDPKQRIVGGIVLFVLMLLLYVFLKLLLGLSTPPERSYLLQDDWQADNASTADPAAAAAGNTPTNAGRPLPKAFVFLDIDAKPMQNTNGKQPAEMDVETEVLAAADGGTVVRPQAPVPAGTEQWVVQVASFKDEESANRLIEKTKEKGLTTEIFKVGNWFTVRFPPQTDRAEAEKQQQQLRKLIGKKGLIKKVTAP